MATEVTLVDRDQLHAYALERLREADSFVLAVSTDDPLEFDLMVAVGARLPEDLRAAVQRAWLLVLREQLGALAEEHEGEGE